MKLFLSFILVFFIFFYSKAQTVENTVKYIWKNDVTNISASVEIYGLQKSNNSFCIFYLNSADTVYNNISDSLFNYFVNISTLNCPVIKINFYNFLDTVPQHKIKLYAKEFSEFILADISKKYLQINTGNLLVSGIDIFGAVALFSAINDPLKINKTALFMNENKESVLSLTVSATDAKKLKGKLYLYVNHQESYTGFTDSLANNIGINSSAVLYKYDVFDKRISTAVISEAYKWLLADGNNYIIEDVD